MIKLESWNGSRKGMQVMWGMLNSMTFRGLWAFSSPSPSHCRLLYVGCLKWVAKRSALCVSCWMQGKKERLDKPRMTCSPTSIHSFHFIHCLFLFRVMGVATVHHSKDTHSVTHSHMEAVWTSVHDAAPWEKTGGETSERLHWKM